MPPASRAQAQLVDEDRVGAAQQVGVLARDRTQDAHAEARARERVAEHHLARQAERLSQLAHFVLEQFPQRLEELQVQRLGQAAHVVVRLDRVRLLGLGAGRLDDVGIDGPLRQPLRGGPALGQLRRFALEDVDEQAADDPPLLLGIGDAVERRVHLVGGVDVDHAHAEVAGERVQHLLPPRPGAAGRGRRRRR